MLYDFFFSETNNAGYGYQPGFARDTTEIAIRKRLSRCKPSSSQIGRPTAHYGSDSFLEPENWEPGRDKQSYRSSEGQCIACILLSPSFQPHVASSGLG